MKRPHYAWAICFACALQLFCIWGICATSFPVFNPYLMKAGHLTNTEVALIPTVRMIFICIGLTVCHHVHMKLGLRLSAFLSLIGCMTGLLIFAFSASAWMYYLASAVIGFSYAIGSLMLVSMVLPRWFHSHMPFAMGICSASSGLAAVIFPPILTPIMDKYSVREGLLMQAGVVAVCAVLVLLIMRNHPRDLGLKPFSDEENEKKKTIRKSAGVHSKRAVMLAVVAYGFFSGMACVGTNQLSMILTTNGYNSMEIAKLLSMYGAVLTGSKILYGKLEDVFGNRYVGLGAFIIEILGSAFLCFSVSHVFGYAGVTLYALGLPLSTIGIPLFAEDLCPPGEYERVNRTMNMTMFVCGLIVAPLSGMLADFTGSYIPSYAIFSAGAAVAFILISIAYFTRPRT